MIIRAETIEDKKAIRHITEQAFGRPVEADLIETLRQNERMILSLVAVHDEQLVGHIFFFPVVIEVETHRYAGVGLGPMAVLPEFQGQGTGTALVQAGIEELRKQGHNAVIVLGHPDFYPRFGFVPATTYGLQSRYEVPDEVFMALELQPGGLTGKSGTVVYSAEFDEV